MGIRFAIALVLLPLPSVAWDLQCDPTDRGWTLTVTGETAVYKRSGRTTEFEIMHQTTAEPGPWPVALTLLSRSDTAIALLFGEDAATRVELLTQDRGLPVVFTGICKRIPKPEIVQ